jgi:ComF family protein
MAKLLDGLTRVAADLLFPPQCVLCGAGGTLLCDACTDALPLASGARCDICWMPIRRGGPCAHCTAEPPRFTSLRAAFAMQQGARRLAHELKYEGMTALAEPMAALIAAQLRTDGADIVVPIPLYPSRERARGYNQAAELARHLAACAGVPLDARAARRLRNTEPLAKTMHREQRRAIVAGAFAARRDRVEARRILLIDDVVTTGATLDSCASALLDAGAAEVRCLTWARAD